jgi:hypothetical protein
MIRPDELAAVHHREDRRDPKHLGFRPLVTAPSKPAEPSESGP